MCTLRASQDTLVTATVASAVTIGYNFSLTGANVNSGFFDQYKIEAVRVSVVPRNNAVNLQTGLTDLYCVIDYDDSNSLSSSNQAQNYANCIKLAPGESCARTFTPRIAVAAYTGTFSGFTSPSPQWLDAASPAIQHYGFKIYVPATGVIGQTVFQQWDINFEYYICFRNVI
jgi:hypothetical protein